MLYITGDCHGNFIKFTKRQRIKLTEQLTEDDYVIVCGDFGLCWAEDSEFKYNCDWMARLPFTILFVDGNHENHKMLSKYPVESWNGGLVHHIVRDKVIHLMRGQVFTLEGKTFFTMGGAKSHDIQGGILDIKDPDYQKKKKSAIQRNLPYRVLGYSYWREEMPSMLEYIDAQNSLKRVKYRVDYVISHCGSNSMQELCSLYDMKTTNTYRVYERDTLTDFFEELESKLKYKHWFCGHYHKDTRLDAKHTVVYNDMLLLLGQKKGTIYSNCECENND